MSDYMDRTLGLGYAKGSLIIASTLCGIFLLWSLSGSIFSVEKIATFRGECFYWSAILVSNTLGTALGDFLADDFGFGGSDLFTKSTAQGGLGYGTIGAYLIFAIILIAGIVYELMQIRKNSKFLESSH